MVKCAPTKYISKVKFEILKKDTYKDCCAYARITYKNDYTQFALFCITNTVSLKLSGNYVKARANIYDEDLCS